jgi:hypothetical protein
MNVFICNGAPFSGKDTLVTKILSYFGEHGVLTRFKDPLYARFSERHNLPLEKVIEICNGPQKDQPCDLIGGLIPRQELIDISENGIKKELGETGVAYLTAENILSTEEHGRKTFVMPDGGFEKERAYLQTALRRFGLTGLYVLRILRDGYTFEAVNDSRSFVSNPDLIIDNNVHESEEERGNHMFQQWKVWYETEIMQK